MQAAHDFNVQGLQRVARGLNEVDAGMDAVVHNVLAVDPVLSLQIGVKALLNVLDDWSPRVIVVDKVTESGSVDDSQAEANTVLLDIRADRLNRHRLRDDVVAGALALLGGVEGSIEQGVDQGGLPEPGFTWKSGDG